jgi:hypothetical protein
MLVLLRERFMKYAVEMASGGMICFQSFITIGSGIQVVLRVISSTILEAVVLVLLMRGIY